MIVCTGRGLPGRQVGFAQQVKNIPPDLVKVAVLDADPSDEHVVATGGEFGDQQTDVFTHESLATATHHAFSDFFADRKSEFRQRIFTFAVNKYDISAGDGDPPAIDVFEVAVLAQPILCLHNRPPSSRSRFRESRKNSVKKNSRIS